MRIAVLVKQIPRVEELRLGGDGRLDRSAVEFEINPFCRRAVAKGVELVAAHGGECVVLTMGPPPAEDALREALAWGATRGVHLCDPAFAGSDTLATAAALAAAIRQEGEFDLVLAGRSSVDADTGQVGPELAQLFGWPMLSAVRELVVDPVTRQVRARCEADDGHLLATTRLPAVLTTAERLCAPAKAPETARAAVDAGRIRRVSASELGEGPWGGAASPTTVGEIRAHQAVRRRRVLDGPVSAQVAEVADELRERGLLGDPAEAVSQLEPLPAARPNRAGAVVAVHLDRDREDVARELLGQAALLADKVSGTVLAVTGQPHLAPVLATWGADSVLPLTGSTVEQDVASALATWCGTARPWALLFAGTISGREIAARVAAQLGAGLTGDAVDLTVEGAALVAWKPAFGGQLVAAITSSSDVQAVTIRPGVLPLRLPRPSGHPQVLAPLEVSRLSPTVHLEAERDDQVEQLARASAVIAVGQGVAPEEYALLEPLRGLLDAEMAGTRKVTDQGWLPRARQVGITGRSISPRLFVSIGASGRFNHMVGARGAHLVLAINSDPSAEIFEVCDLGIVADWREVAGELAAAIGGRMPERSPALRSAG